MQEMTETNESLGVQVVTITEMQEAKEKQLKEMCDLKKNRELELSQLTNRFNDLQAEFEELQLDKSRHHQIETELIQTINDLKTDKEQAKESLGVLQKQNDELTRQLEEITMKLQSDIDVQKNKYERVLENMKNRLKKKNCEARENRDCIEKLQNEGEKLRKLISQMQRMRTPEQQETKNLRPLDPKL